MIETIDEEVLAKITRRKSGYFTRAKNAHETRRDESSREHTLADRALLVRVEAARKYARSRLEKWGYLRIAAHLLEKGGAIPEVPDGTPRTKAVQKRVNTLKQQIYRLEHPAD